MTTRVITSDSLGRLPVGYPGRRYLVHEDADGTLVLEPAVVMSELEARLLANRELQDQIDHARATTDERVRRRQRE